MKKITNLPKDIMEDSILEESTISGYHDYLEIKNSKIISSNLEKCIFQGLDIEATQIEKSNLSNLNLTDHSFKTIKFIDCNLVGINFIDSYLEDVTFENCNLLYSNFSSTNLKQVKFNSCNLEHVLYGRLEEFSDEEKQIMSDDFADRYDGKVDEFIEFISDSAIAVAGAYQKTWDYIEKGKNSLNRHSNMNLIFNHNLY